MDEKALILLSSVEHDLSAIDQIYQELGEPEISPESEYRDLVFVAFQLHHLYNAFENIFLNVAAALENSIEDTERWRAQLLERMLLDVLPLRPKLIDNQAYIALDELRRFRHLFRHAYRTRLDAERLHLVLRKALNLKRIYQAQIETFLSFVRTLD